MKSHLNPPARTRLLLSLLLATLLSFALLPLAAFADPAAPDLFGTLEAYSTFRKGDVLSDSFCYTDQWFLADPEERNDSLALLSMQLVAAAVNDEPDGASASLLHDLGFENVSFEHFQSSDMDDCSYTWSTKTIQDGSDTYTLVVVAVQSYSFDPDNKTKAWQQNFTINGATETTGEHYNYGRVADTMVSEIAGLGGSGKVKVWIFGQSRGGALASLIAARLPQQLGAANAGIYAYTFESPATMDDGTADASSYGYIHNYVCSDDIVPMVPMWGMVRYGSGYQLNTEEANEQIVDELTKLGSAAAEEDVPDAEEMARNLVARLEEQVPTRADYSAPHTDSFTDAGGSEVSVTYCYQDTMVRLMKVIFDNELALSMDVVDEHVSELLPAVQALATGVALDEGGQRDEAAPYFWTAQQVIYPLLLEMSTTGSLSIDETDVYALLRLAGPILVNPSYEPTGEDYPDLMGYLNPGISIAMSADALTYSHQFDTILARLHVLAPQPALEDLDIPVSEPLEGDAATKAPEEVEAFIASLEQPWLTVESAWSGSDQTLEGDSDYYLNVTLRAVAHTVSDDWSLTVNGQDPVSAPTVTHENGASVIRATWAFTVGEPSSVTISFDTKGIGSAPEPIEVPKGSVLAYRDAPGLDTIAKSGGATWRLDGWQSEDGTPWNSLVARQDMTVYATWVRVVDDISISVPTQKLGEAPAMPTIPEDAPYHLEEVYFTDYTFDSLDVYDYEGLYNFSCNVVLKDSENSEFALRPDGWGDDEYAGTIKVNGEEISASYDSGGGYLIVSLKFTIPEGKVPTAPSYYVAKGDGQTWTKGSGASARFVFKRNYFDDETFGRFEGIKVDGKAVDASNYTAEAGSVNITLKPAYLQTLSTGSHTLTAQFDDGSADAGFTIKAAKDDSGSGGSGGSGGNNGSGSNGKNGSGGKSNGSKTSSGTSGSSKSSSGATLAKTGDTSVTGPVVALAACACVLLLTSAKLRKRH